MTRTHHLCISVRGALENWNTGRLRNLFEDENGKPLTAKEAKSYLLDCLAEGKIVIPVGEPCEGWSYKTGCPGHDKIENKTKAI